MRFLIFTTLILTGCVTPDRWSVNDHHSMMISCRQVCGKEKVKSYEPLTGECQCVVKDCE